ncbi:MAG: sulfatase [Candidatus Altiarchaeota archaeon]
MASRTCFMLFTVVLLSVACISEPPSSKGKTTTTRVWDVGVDYKCVDCNVIILTVETFRADHVTSNGYHRNITPRLDEFGRENIQFDKAFVQSPWTLPSLASILSSLYPSQHGLVGPRVALNDNVKTLAETLSENGYYTYYNYNAWFPLADLGFSQGFVERGPGGRADGFRQQTINFMRAHRNEKFLIWLHYNEPHQPYNPQEGYDSLFIKDIPEKYYATSRGICKETVYTPKEVEYLTALYDGEIRFADEHIGGLIDGVKELGLYNKTIIIVVGDHGEEFQDHGGCDHGHTHYDELIHVPLFMRIPSITGVRVPYQVREVDIPPTILDTLDIPYNGYGGETLIPVLAGVRNEDLVVYSEAIHPMYAPDQRALRYKGLKLVFWPDASGDDVRWELFDLASDPRELRNVYAVNPGAADDLKGLMSGFLLMANDSNPVNEVEYSVDVEKRLKEIGYLV